MFKGLVFVAALSVTACSVEAGELAPEYSWDGTNLTATFTVPAGTDRFEVVKKAVEMANNPACHYNPSFCQEHGVDPASLTFYSFNGGPSTNDPNSNGTLSVTWQKK